MVEKSVNESEIASASIGIMSMIVASSLIDSLMSDMVDNDGVVEEISLEADEDEDHRISHIEQTNSEFGWRKIL